MLSTMINYEISWNQLIKYLSNYFYLSPTTRVQRVGLVYFEYAYSRVVVRLHNG